MDRVKLYKSYGVIAHEAHPVYTIGTPASDIYDIIEVTIPNGVTASKNKAGEIIFEFEDAPKQRFTARETLSNRGETPILRFWDFDREGPNATMRWVELKEITDIGSLRRKRGLTQEQLSEKSGVKLSTLQKLENGANNIKQARVETVNALAHALNVSMDELLK